MNDLEKAKGHFKTITQHKLTVMDLCFKVGLIKQGLLHDLTKYEPVEFLTGVKYYQGDKSPNAVEKKEKGYSDAWLHHKGVNKHHFEYWLDLGYQPVGKIVPAKMPVQYVLEMACDRIAACKTYHGDKYKDSDPWEYYEAKAYAVEPHLHPETAALLKKILKLLADEGEEKALAYMRWILKHPWVYSRGYEG